MGIRSKRKKVLRTLYCKEIFTSSASIDLKPMLKGMSLQQRKDFLGWFTAMDRGYIAEHGTANYSWVGHNWQGIDVTEENYKATFYLTDAGRVYYEQTYMVFRPKLWHTITGFVIGVSATIAALVSAYWSNENGTTIATETKELQKSIDSLGSEIQKHHKQDSATHYNIKPNKKVKTK